MAGLVAAYDSEEEEEATPAPAAPEEQHKVSVDGQSAAASGAKKAEPKKKAAAAVKHTSLHKTRLRDIQIEIRRAKSATSVVRTVRTNLQPNWDVRWTADALYQIAKRSTARTRKEWGADVTVKKLGARLSTWADEQAALEKLEQDTVDLLLVALDGLRRMAFQEPEAQKPALEKIVKMLVATSWSNPIKSVARLFWLGSPLKLQDDFLLLSSAQLRGRAQDLDGPDVALLVNAMRQDGVRDQSLLDKILGRLRHEGIFAGLSATDLIEIAEGLKERGVQDQSALRPLGQEILRRRGELTPDESHRVHAVFQAMGLPLPEVWMKPGSSVKRDGAQIATTQAFAPEEGHEKKRRGNNEISRVSPPTVTRDRKMCSY